MNNGKWMDLDWTLELEMDGFRLDFRLGLDWCNSRSQHNKTRQQVGKKEEKKQKERETFSFIYFLLERLDDDDEEDD